MLLNDIEMDIKTKLVESRRTQLDVATEAGFCTSYMTRLMRKTHVVNRTLVSLMEVLGYDVRIEYVRRDGR